MAPVRLQIRCCTYSSGTGICSITLARQESGTRGYYYSMLTIKLSLGLTVLFEIKVISLKYIYIYIVSTFSPQDLYVRDLNFLE
jgi:hypothetical protein